LLNQTARSLCYKFGDDKRIDTFTAGDAETYRKWLQSHGNERKKYKTGLAKNTVRRMIGRSKQFFKAAMKHEIIHRNPFENEASSVGGNEDRLFLVPAEWIETCIRKAPCEDWRIILAFARYAGMRSHETRIQKWDDIDLVNNVMVVRSNKTPAVRRCPIFPELRPHLLRAREMAPEGAIYVQTRYSHDANITTTLEKIILKAGLTPWPKLMQNLRATRETELLAHYPAKDVTSWLGNSPEVANRHYAMTGEL
jgi:integrase